MTRIILALTFLPYFASAQLQLAKIFSDNMVLQRDKPIPIWGISTPGQVVALSFGNENKRVITKPDSTWHVYFKKQKANQRAQSVFIQSGKENIELKNILIGDVWICSGQSNMEWTMQKEMFWKEASKNADQPLIRFANPPPAGRYVYGTAYTDSLNKRLTKEDFYMWDGWMQSNSHTIKSMSAVAWYFAKQIVQQENIPIGLINLSIGGAPIETFISNEAMKASEKFSAKVRGDWLQNNNLPGWVRERGIQNVGNNPNGYRDELGLNHAYKPGFAFEAGIKPILSMPISGIIWYQGESNSLEVERVEEYRELQKLMIANYRKQWQRPKMPFYWVQLSSIDTSNYQSKYWPEFRDEQRLLLNEVRHTGMAVSSDIGKRNDVHPTNKKLVGERLARWALFDHYGNEKIIPSGPLVAKVMYTNGRVTISFRYGKGLATADAMPLRGFSLDGINPAVGRIRGNSVVISTTVKPAFVYYAWKPFTDANLVNAQQLPTSTFKIPVD